MRVLRLHHANREPKVRKHLMHISRPRSLHAVHWVGHRQPGVWIPGLHRSPTRPFPPVTPRASAVAPATALAVAAAALAAATALAVAAAALAAAALAAAALAATALAAATRSSLLAHRALRHAPNAPRWPHRHL